MITETFTQSRRSCRSERSYVAEGLDGIASHPRRFVVEHSSQGTASGRGNVAHVSESVRSTGPQTPGLIFQQVRQRRNRGRTGRRQPLGCIQLHRVRVRAFEICCESIFALSPQGRRQCRHTLLTHSTETISCVIAPHFVLIGQSAGQLLQ